MPAINLSNERKLSAEHLRSVLSYEPETGVFRWKENRRGPKSDRGDMAGTARADGRKQIRIGYVRYLASRLAWLYVHGEWPEEYIDHIDRNRGNDAISNLRQVNGRQNRWNSGVRANKSLGLRNIYKHRNRYVVGINQKVGGPLVRESFASLVEAINARDVHLVNICGAYFPTSPDK